MSIKLFDLTGKHALVTGGSHGIGMAIATGLAEAGAAITVIGTNAGKLEDAKKAYADNKIDAHTCVLNITDEDAVTKTIPVIENEVAPIDILVNNAGMIKRVPLREMTAEDFRQVLDVNLTGQFIMAKAVVEGMIARGHGKIINMCSMMSELGRNTVGAYAASKGGLKMLTRNMATEWARHNIQTNGIGPGYIATSQTAPLRVEGNPFNDFIISRTPTGRWGNAEDLAGAAIFLASKASDFVNGHIVYVDGGILATIGKPSNEE